MRLNCITNLFTSLWMTSKKLIINWKLSYTWRFSNSYNISIFISNYIICIFSLLINILTIFITHIIKIIWQIYNNFFYIIHRWNIFNFLQKLHTMFFSIFWCKIRYCTIYFSMCSISINSNYIFHYIYLNILKYQFKENWY